MTKYNEFEETAKELDSLALSGFYGEDVRELTAKRDEMDTTEYFYQNVKLWLDDKTQYGKHNVKSFIGIFLNFFGESTKVDAQETVDILNVFFFGTQDNPGLESLSSYNEFSIVFTDTKNKLIRFKNSELNYVEKKGLASDLVNVYAKGVEMFSKILTYCIALNKLSQNEKYNLYKIHKMTLHKKIEEIECHGHFKSMTSIINRFVRNSEAHLSIVYKPDLNKYAYKKTTNGKIETEFINMDEVILQLFPSVGWITQAFMYSIHLLVLFHDDRAKFNELAKEIDAI
ncbi:hypothetical protein NRS6085_09755 [Bacillus subtilis]|uniref:hypothetical protein n=1 Tax=Bacillus subtilis TaxID=1423 RepID=UPI001B9E5389|nr:hypothetical protein [Bacillus subtilis]CAF1783578.1 hypothetical protein NRS6085_00926 [Bacillus subtilis]CAI6265924.1 hypothetical protein NRS6085_09755 [Bacillus subtilis]